MIQRLAITMALVAAACGPRPAAQPPVTAAPVEAVEVDAAPAPPAVDAAPDATPGPSDADLAVLVDELVTVVEAMVTATQQRGADCAGLAADLGALQAEHGTLRERLQAVTVDPAVADRFEAVMATRRDRFQGALARFGQALRCGDDPAIARAIDELFRAGR